MMHALVSPTELFLQSPRLSPGQKPILARRLRDILLHLLQTTAGVTSDGTKVIVVGNVDVLYATPFCSHAPEFACPYGLEIWAEGAKTASIWWGDREGDIEVLSLKRGPWIATLYAAYRTSLSH